MTKFTAPQMDVIRFNESDVIVASNSGKTLRIIGAADGEVNNASFAFGGDGGTWNSYQVVYDDPTFLTSVNSYLGTDFNTSAAIKVTVPNGHGGFATVRSLGELAAGDYGSRSDPAYMYDYSVPYTWNSSLNRFEGQ